MICDTVKWLILGVSALEQYLLVVFTFTRVKVSVVVAHEPIGDGEQSGDSRVVWVKH